MVSINPRGGNGNFGKHNINITMRCTKNLNNFICYQRFCHRHTSRIENQSSSLSILIFANGPPVKLFCLKWKTLSSIISLTPVLSLSHIFFQKWSLKKQNNNYYVVRNAGCALDLGNSDACFLNWFLDMPNGHALKPF